MTTAPAPRLATLRDRRPGRRHGPSARRAGRAGGRDRVRLGLAYPARVPRGAHTVRARGQPRGRGSTAHPPDVTCGDRACGEREIRKTYSPAVVDFGYREPVVQPGKVLLHYVVADGQCSHALSR